MKEFDAIIIGAARPDLRLPGERHPKYHAPPWSAPTRRRFGPTPGVHSELGPKR